jgi:hypothetical protein
MPHDALVLVAVKGLVVGDVRGVAELEMSAR